MRHALAPAPMFRARIRRAEAADLDALVAIEREVFPTDRISPRGFRRFRASASASLLVAEDDGRVCGYALVLYRTGSTLARLYSIALARADSRRGLGPALLVAAEDDALARGCVLLRLEVSERNAPALSRYRKSGYRLFGRHTTYYGDGSDALRFEKRLTPALGQLDKAPPYLHQTTEFTCGPACAMMALAWADPSVLMSPELEFRLWREATTIFMSSGHGGCDPFGLAVTLKRRGLMSQIHVSRPGPYFLETVRSSEKRRVMELTQDDFRRQADALHVPVHLHPLGESHLMEALDAGDAAIILVSGYHMVRSREPHWVFAFGREGAYVLVHDPAARIDQGGTMTAATLAVPWVELDRMMRFGRDLRASILIRKGPLQ